MATLRIYNRLPRKDLRVLLMFLTFVIVVGLPGCSDEPADVGEPNPAELRSARESA